MLCDGTSPENAASTVVDCRRINDGDLGFFRIGIMPKGKVLELFQEVQGEVDVEVGNSPSRKPEPLTIVAGEERISGQASPDVIPEYELINKVDDHKELVEHDVKTQSEGFDNPAFSEDM